MDLITDYIEPTEITGYVRTALADLELNKFSLSRWLPSATIDDIDWRAMVGGLGLAQVGEYRTYDTEASIVDREGFKRISGSLPPISHKIRLGEWERLKLRGAQDTTIRDFILADAERVASYIAARVEMARGDLLLDGIVTINENGVNGLTADFGRNGNRTVTASPLWDAANSDPIKDLLSWMEVYRSSGNEVGSLLTSRKVQAALMRNDSIRSLAFGGGNTDKPSILSVDNVNAVFSSYGIPPMYLYDVSLKSNAGSTVRPLPENRLLLLPPPGDALGKTQWGTTVEALSPGYGLQGGDDAPGIVAGSYTTNDPIAVWTKASAIVLPTMFDADLSMTATVIA